MLAANVGRRRETLADDHGLDVGIENDGQQRVLEAADHEGS
jgi:hypothetical protein